MTTRLAISCIVLSSLLTSSAVAQQHTRRGTLLGGVTGAIAGAAIGDNNDEAAAGALIGGALGAITGAAIGNSVDQEHAQAHAVRNYQAQQLSRAVAPADVVHMTQSGLGDTVIINHIRQNGVLHKLEVSDVIALHQQGVSEPVITAMQQARLATAPPPKPVYRSPVVVEEHHYVAPRPVYIYPRPAPRYHYHHYHHHGHRHRPSGVSWSFRVGR